MSNSTRKTATGNVISLVDYKPKVSRADDSKKMAVTTESDELYIYFASCDRFQFQSGDALICRDYCNEQLSPDDLVIGDTKERKTTVTTAANALSILSVIVAFRRDIKDW